MHILFASEGYSPHDFRFLAAIADAGHRVTHVMTDPQSAPRENRESPADRSVRLTDEQFAGRVEEFAALVRKTTPDIIHAGPIQTSGLVAVLARCDVPIVAMSWGSDLLMKAREDRLWAQVAEWVLPKAEVLVADCEAVRVAAERHGFRGPVVTFPWGVDIEQFSPAPQPQSDEGRGLRILSTRNWEPVYDVTTLAEAFCQVAPRWPDLTLALAGRGSREADLRTILEPVSDQVEWVGYVDYGELPGLYRSSDLYVSTSLSDGSSISLLEAMSCGTPVVVSAIPGNREWVVPEENGWLFEPGDAGDLADVLARAITDSKSRRAAARKNREVAEQRADWQKNRTLLEEAYRLAR